MSKVFRDYEEISERLLEGREVTKVLIGINAEGSGMSIELERQGDNVTLGVDIIYDPTETAPLVVSQEYVKHIS